MLRYVSVGKKMTEIPVFEGVIVRKRNFVYVIGMDELFLRSEGRTKLSSHRTIKLLY